MAYTKHDIRPDLLSDKVKSKLKQICSGWTYIGGNDYVAHHAEALNSACPLCKLVLHFKDVP